MTNKPLSTNHKRILKLLKKGRANATTGGELATITGLTPRAVMDVISELVRVYNVPIIGSRDNARYGYYIAETKEELYDGAKTLHAQVKKEQQRLDVLFNADLTEYEQLLEDE